MSLIDTSYFKGPIAIAQLGQQAVKNNLQLFINRYEAKLLQACLGYELYQDFIDGLNQSLIDQKWLDIRDGAIFDATGQWPPLYWQVPYLNSYMRDWYIPMNPRRRMEWIGFTAKASFIDTDASRDQTLVLTVDSGNNNPVSGTNTFSLSSLAGSEYWIERRGIGTLVEDVEVTITNDGQTITLIKPGDSFAPGEIFVLHFDNIIVTGGNANPFYTSPDAAYIYYMHVRDQVTQNTGSGIVNPISENALESSPARKMVDAFNQMSKDIFVLWQFLELKNTDVYPNYDRLKIDYNFFKPINVWNI